MQMSVTVQLGSVKSKFVSGRVVKSEIKSSPIFPI